MCSVTTFILKLADVVSSEILMTSYAKGELHPGEYTFLVAILVWNSSLPLAGVIGRELCCHVRKITDQW